MSRRTAALALTAVALTCAAVPAEAAKKKPKPKPITGSYTVTSPPDATINVLAQASMPGCGVLADEHAFVAPAAGKLVVTLQSDDPTPAASPLHADWDLYVNDAQGEVGSSTSPFATELVSVKLKKKTDLTFVVCNASGLPDATVSYTFTYA